MQYDFKIEPWMVPLLFPFGANQNTSFATIADGKVHIKMGKLFDASIDIDQIETASEGTWNILGGLGHRVGLKKDMAVLASTSNVVKLHFKKPQFLPALGPMHLEINDFYLSLKDPNDFLVELNDEMNHKKE